MIDSPEGLDGLLARIRAADWIAIDTEADSLHAYPEKLCLIQVSMTGSDDLLDPLARLDLAPFWSALHNHELIMHGSDYDLRLMCKTHRFVPTRIFDTVIAARLLGIREFGLTHLVQRFLGVTLEKGSQTADWARRPLTPKMEAYARNDTRYLHPLATLLKNELREKGRLPWAEETCARLIRDAAINPPVDMETVWRIKGSHLLDRAALAVLREIWKWREQEAARANRPPFFVLSHDTAIRVAETGAVGGDWKPILPRSISPSRVTGLQEAIRAGRQLPPRDFPDILRHQSHRPTEGEKQRFAALQTRRDQAAQELAIDPTLIASRATLVMLSSDWETEAPKLMQWQRALISPG